MSDELGVESRFQNWASSTPDGPRHAEGAAFLDEDDLASTQVFHMIDLLLASANERLLDDPAAELEAVDAARRAVAEHHVEYWSQLDDAEEFPIVACGCARVARRSRAWPSLGGPV